MDEKDVLDGIELAFLMVAQWCWYWLSLYFKLAAFTEIFFTWSILVFWLFCYLCVFSVEFYVTFT